MTRMFAVLPAAGQSRRMGQPKLLLPWGNFPTLLDAVLTHWRAAVPAHVVLVLRADDAGLLAIARRHPIQVVAADPPPRDMKVSVQLALTWIAEHLQPNKSDAWLLSPADVPWISPQLLSRMRAAHASNPDCIVVPSFQQRRGHPVLFPWPLAAEVAALAEDEGVNILARRHPTIELVENDSRIVEDIDTPQDYQRLRPRH
jgi:molybdenum cofactor cytidylyltransferase